MLLSALWAPCSAAVVVTLHGDTVSVLAEVLQPFTPLPVSWARAGDLLHAGHIYVAPPGAHLVINPDARFAVSKSPRVGFYRPSADWLFESASASFCDRHVAVVLSGMMSDGARSLRKVHRSGGTVLVQDPREAPFADMPLAAIATNAVDAVLPVAGIADEIRRCLAAHDAAADAVAWEFPFAAPLGGIASA